MPSRESERRPRKRRISVKEEDLEELYLLVQGAPYANTVLDAKASLAQEDFEKTLQLIESAEARFQQSNRRLLRQELEPAEEGPKTSQQQARRLKQKQDRCKSVLEAFDDVMSVLRRMIRLRRGGKRLAETAELSAPTTEQLLQQGSAFRVEYEMARSTRLQLAIIQRFFVVREVKSSADIIAKALYYYRGKDHRYLVVVQNAVPSIEELPLRLALSDQRMKPVSRNRFIEMGRGRSLLRLVPRGADDADDADDADSAASTYRLLEEQVEGIDPTASRRVEILDIGAFSQLHDAAIRSGLVSNADSIAHVRDREFRRGDYQKAFQVIEGLFGKFTAAATQRDQRMRREDVDIASGKLRMSPKALMEKRARDTAETQRVERARGRFLRILEGLRVLMRNEPQDL